MLKERRRFKRFPLNTHFSLSRDYEIFMAETVDYSFEGLCAVIDGVYDIRPGDVLDIVLDRPGFKGKGRVAWTKPARSGLMAGILRLGQLYGSLEDFNLADVLIGLQRSGKTGIFHLLHGSVHKNIYIQGGDMIFAASNQPEDRLGDMLLAQGRINREQYDRSVEMMKSTKRRQGAAMVELGYMDPRELLRAVKEQVENIILSLFAFSEGNVVFKEGPLPTKEVVTLRLSAANLICRGIKRMEDVERIRKLCPPADTVLVLASDPLDLFQDLRFEEEDKRLLSIINGKMTFKEVIKECGGDVLDTMKALYAFLSTRIIERAGEAHDPLEADEEEFVTADDIINAQEMILETEGETALEFAYKIDEMHESCKTLGYYGVLGVDRTASAAEIKRAYYQRAMEFHPDRHFQLPDEMKDKLNAIFAYISTAFSTLDDGEQRRLYDEKMRASSG